MGALLRMRPEQHKTAARVETPKGEAQRRRREKEHLSAGGVGIDRTTPGR
jgi:hypothetical protein